MALFSLREAFFSGVCFPGTDRLSGFCFSSFGGLAYLLNPTFGFLLGFLISAPFLSFLFRRGRVHSRGKMILLSFGAILLLYLPGLLYLWWSMAFLLGKPVDFYTTLQIGFFPFVVLDLLKASGASLLAFHILRRLGRFK